MPTSRAQALCSRHAQTPGIRHARARPHFLIHSHIPSFIPTFPHSLPHSFIHRHILPFILIFRHTLVHSFIHSRVPFIRTFLHSFLHFFIHSRIPSSRSNALASSCSAGLYSPGARVHANARSLALVKPRCLLLHSPIRLRILSFTPAFLYSLLHSLIHSHIPPFIHTFH